MSRRPSARPRGRRRPARACPPGSIPVRARPPERPVPRIRMTGAGGRSRLARATRCRHAGIEQGWGARESTGTSASVNAVCGSPLVNRQNAAAARPRALLRRRRARLPRARPSSGASSCSAPVACASASAEHAVGEPRVPRQERPVQVRPVRRGRHGSPRGRDSPSLPKPGEHAPERLGALVEVRTTGAVVEPGERGARPGRTRGARRRSSAARRRSSPSGRRPIPGSSTPPVAVEPAESW